MEALDHAVAGGTHLRAGSGRSAAVRSQSPGRTAVKIEISETDRHERELTRKQADLLRASQLVGITQVHGSRTRWTLTAKRKVGVARVGDIELWITPKLPIKRLLFMLDFAHKRQGWLPDEAKVGEADGLVSTVATLLVTQVDRALSQGPLQGYRHVDEQSYVLRGRVQTAAHIQLHHGTTSRLDVTHDDLVTDTVENRILLSTIRKVLDLPRVDEGVRLRLAAHQAQLTRVCSPIRGPRLPVWTPGKPNLRYQPALRLAELIWRSCSPEYGSGGVEVNGFLFQLDQVFEDFVCLALKELLEQRHGGRASLQHTMPLDDPRSVGLRPDLMWRDETRTGVVDAKYMVDRSNPRTELFQMLAYCTVLGTRTGHLIYAGGSEHADRRRIVNSDITVVSHSLRLDTQPAEVLEQLTAIADEIAGQ
ncbi:restriction endonuclease [Pseudonocardiaceae bacterium YIM PH 21723]|nr:restriction endonuclease [Pseudonocardiaceae bacterium YIM PH 21723]